MHTKLDIYVFINGSAGRLVLYTFYIYLSPGSHTGTNRTYLEYNQDTCQRFDIWINGTLYYVVWIFSLFEQAFLSKGETKGLVNLHLTPYDFW